MWVFGVLRETLRTITQFITTIVVTDIANIKYLQSNVQIYHSTHLFNTVSDQQRLDWNLKAITWTYLPIRGTALEVSGTFLAIRKRNTVWPRRVAIDMVHFWPPAGNSNQYSVSSSEGLCLWKQILMTYCETHGAKPLCYQSHEGLEKIVMMSKLQDSSRLGWDLMWQRSDYLRLGFWIHKVKTKTFGR